MFLLDSSAASQLAPETLAAAELFLGALPPSARQHLRSVRLFGAHARRFEPEAALELLIETDRRSIEVRTALALATHAVESEGEITVQLTVVTPFEVSEATGVLARTLGNARREGLDLWVREDVETSTLH